ncbi:hypothetical protein FGO68_gene7517 [Halteria grandinella]|uniref:Uncharacterized protein n=1 Tax=Halteria grandinella TaxID=5974 RepID=A0A8J8NGN5_HALGN|nr:hypothetical protein FGO68_gene7517 [Halteria grandinella]
MTYKQISLYTGVRVQTVSSILATWRQNGFKLISRIYLRRKKSILSKKHEQQIVNPKNLYEQAHLTLKQRVTVLHEKHHIPLISLSAPLPGSTTAMEQSTGGPHIFTSRSSSMRGCSATSSRSLPLK